MKQILVYTVFMSIAICSYAQQQTINLSKDPYRQESILPKSNAQLLTEPGTQTTTGNPEFSEQYRPDAANDNSTSTSRGLMQGNTSPGNASDVPQMMNTTNTQYNLGNGTKANSTIYYDDVGKVKSSGTSIQFGTKKK